MNREQLLIVKLMEECAEVIQACSKALNYGLDDGYLNTDRTNREKYREQRRSYRVLQKEETDT